jgi:ferredoxin
MGHKVVIDEECCIGCGSCDELCPHVFEMDEEAEKARVIRPKEGMSSVLKKLSRPVRLNASHGRNGGAPPDREADWRVRALPSE